MRSFFHLFGSLFVFCFVGLFGLVWWSFIGDYELSSALKYIITRPNSCICKDSIVLSELFLFG